MIKSPKIYIRDSGLIHCLMGIETYNDLLGHPCLGNSYEALKVIKPDKAFVIVPVDESYPLKGDVWVHKLQTFLNLEL